MAKITKTLFISDLHLSETHPEITNRFLQLLNNCDSNVDALYILGDLFDAWIGDDNDSTLYQNILQAMYELTQKGLPIYFLHGNRDFLIGKKFLNKAGATLLLEEEIINLYGTRVLIMHGDTLCTRDITYMKARKKLRNRFLQKIFLLLPLKIRKNFAEKMREKSMQYTQSTPLEIMDVTQEEVERVMRKYTVNYLIHGHTHRPNIHTFLLDQIQVSRIVLGAWHERGSALEWDSSGERKLIEL